MNNVRLQMLPFILPLSCWFHFMFTAVRHSFASLRDKHLLRKATLMYQLFQRTYLILLFSFKSTQKCSRQNLAVRKKKRKRIAVSQRPGGQYAFFRMGPTTNRRAPWPEKKLGHIIKVLILGLFLDFSSQNSNLFIAFGQSC